MISSTINSILVLRAVVEDDLMILIVGLHGETLSLLVIRSHIEGVSVQVFCQQRTDDLELVGHHVTVHIKL